MYFYKGRNSLIGLCARLVLAGGGGKVSPNTDKSSHNLTLPGISIQCSNTE